MTTPTTLTQNKVILLLPYFGRWPEYFTLYLNSCNYNKWMDVLFLTDCPIPENYPPNVRFIKSSLSQISSLIVQKLGIIGYQLSSAYKLCDFKPTYGALFEDHIVNYEYWGYGDIDLIYGNLYGKVKTEMEAGLDLISARAEIVSGSFTLLKNNTYNNQLFRKLTNFNQLVISDQYEGIDETSHNSTIWTGLNKLELPQSSFTYLIAKEATEGHIKASFQTFICENLPKQRLIKYHHQELYFEGQPIGYFHYVMNKRRIYFTYPNWKNLPEVFYITETGFYKYLWQAVILSPLKKISSLFFYYLKKMPSFTLKTLSKPASNN
ncbi:MAG: DUF6625 family protein [Bacteroidota bacterium]